MENKDFAAAALLAVFMELLGFLMMAATVAMPSLLNYNVGLVGLIVAGLGLLVIPAELVTYYSERNR